MDRRGDVFSGHERVAGRPAWHYWQPDIYLAQAGYARGALTAAGIGEEVVSASEYRALQNQVADMPIVKPEALLADKDYDNDSVLESLQFATFGAAVIVTELEACDT